MYYLSFVLAAVSILALYKLEEGKVGTSSADHHPFLIILRLYRLRNRRIFHYVYLRSRAQITSRKDRYFCMRDNTRNIYVLIIFILGNLSRRLLRIHFCQLRALMIDSSRGSESAGFLGSRENRHVPAVKFGVIRMSHLPT